MTQTTYAASVSQPNTPAVSLEQQSLTQETATQVLTQAKETHRTVNEWVRALDFKIAPILVADSALLAGVLTFLSQQAKLLESHPITQLLLILTLFSLLISVLFDISAVSPSLKIAPWGRNRHRADVTAGQPISLLFYGHIAAFTSADDYARAAKSEFLDVNALIDDLLLQTYQIARVAANKSAHIALSARGLFAAIILIFAAFLAFASSH